MTDTDHIDISAPVDDDDERATSTSTRPTRPTPGVTLAATSSSPTSTHGTLISGQSLPVTTVEDKPWGRRDFTLTDPSGNQLRIGRSSSPRGAVDAGCS